MDLLFLVFFGEGRRGVSGCASLQDFIPLTRVWTWVSGPWQWKYQVLTTGPPGNSFESSFILSDYYIIASTLGYYGNTAMNIWVQVFGGGMFSVLLGIVIGIYIYTYMYLKLLGDLINLFITLWGTVELFSKMITPLYIRTGHLWES